MLLVKKYSGLHILSFIHICGPIAVQIQSDVECIWMLLTIIYRYFPLGSGEITKVIPSQSKKIEIELGLIGT